MLFLFFEYKLAAPPFNDDSNADASDKVQSIPTGATNITGDNGGEKEDELLALLSPSFSFSLSLLY